MPEDVDVPIEAMVEKEPITVILSQKGWIRSMKGYVPLTDEFKFKEDDALQFAIHAYTTDKIILFDTSGKFFNINANEIPSGRGFGQPVRLMADLGVNDNVCAMFAFEKGENGDLLIMKAPACTIGTQAEAVCELFGGKKEDIKVIGIRHGEKMYETLLTNEECAKAIDLGGFYRVPADNRGLNYDKYFKEGDAKRNTLTEFNSNNTRMLNLEETKATIAKLAYIQERLAED